ncbi:cell wall hydrolase [Azospirillum sp. ST 5-10]|uniref:cell wall hydrolase n=1 Tax=unclassified Azospirillum TaxID=2630922 RepID=UPI003F4A362D
MKSEREIVARTLWGEARGQGHKGMEAVACVIRNRATHPRWWSRNKADDIPDDTFSAVCLDPWQFSCWLAKDPNRAKLLAVTEADPAYRLALEVADDVLAGRLEDVTNGADHYCTRAAASRTSWAKGRKPVATVGDHLFYRLELPPPNAMKPLAKSKTVQGGAASIAVAGGIAAAQEVVNQVGAARAIWDQLRGSLPEVHPGWLAAAVLAIGVGFMLWRRRQDHRAAGAS